MQRIFDMIGGLLSNAVLFFAAYFILLLPTYYLPYVGSNSFVVATLGAATGIGLSPQFWMHALSLYMLVVVAWLRGCQIGKQWIAVLPAVAAVFDMTPGLSLIPLIPTVMHLVALVLGVRGATSKDFVPVVPLFGGIAATIGCFAMVLGLIHGFTWRERIAQSGQGAASTDSPTSQGSKNAPFPARLWTPAGQASLSGQTARLVCGGSASTIGKATISGDPLVIEAKFVGPGQLRDTRIELVDASNDTNRIYVGDTNYRSDGLYTIGSGIFDLAQAGNGFSLSKFQEYRITIQGTSLKVQRGDSLSNLTETRSVTLGHSISGMDFYLVIGTGNPDYCPGEFEWIRATGLPQ